MARASSLLAKEERGLIAMAVRNFHSLTGVPVALGAQVTGAGELRVVAGEGLRTDALRNLRIDAGTGIGGRVYSMHRVMGVTDYTRSHSITHDLDPYVVEEGLRSVAAVPVTVSREVRAVLYAAVHSAVRLSDRVLEELTQEARCLEQEIAVMDATADLWEESKETFARLGQQRPTPVGEQVRHAHSRLRLINSRIEDEEVRRDIEAVCDMLITTPRVPSSGTQLSTRELDVLSCVAMGRTNMEAANEMGIGAETVKSYLRSCMGKLGAHNRYEAVSIARYLGVLP